ncbi:UNVERIFIED_CONTAM: hypothetical protein HDU68_006502 [Siphonaria sp. JEL0065]|nr:hypothetical protein HDU68_006502 [Siphonaria sp. JEL0065]
MKQLFRRISNIGSRSNGSQGSANSMFGQGLDQMLSKDQLKPSQQNHHYHHHHHHKQKGASSSGVSSAVTLGSADSVVNDKEVPVVLQKFVEYLSSKEALAMEGIFRVAAPVKQVKELPGFMDFSKLDAYDGIHVVASVFKQWIRDIPDGIVPKKFFQLLVDCGASAPKLQHVIQSLPKPNRDFLEYLIKYLLKLVTYSSKNLMTIQNLVIVFAPNLFKCPSAPSPTSPNANPEKYLVESMQMTKIMANIMENFEEVFQLRQTDEQPNSIIKALEIVDKAPEPELLNSGNSVVASNSSEKDIVVASNLSPLLKSMTKSRPKPPGRRPPSAPKDAKNRNGEIFDDSVQIRPGIPTIQESSHKETPHLAQTTQNESNIKLSASNNSLKAELDASKKKSVTFFDTDISLVTVKRISPPPAPKKPAPAAPTQTIQSKVIVADKDFPKELFETDSVISPLPLSAGDGSERDGDDELSGLRENGF